jgi:hypothetical protein
MAGISKQPTAPYNPFFGCAVMVIVAATLLGIVAWSFYALTTQDQAINQFTVDQPVALHPVRLTETETSALLESLKPFATAAAAGTATTVELTIAELNTLIAIAPDSGYGQFTELIAFKSAQPEEQLLVADVCLPMNRMKFWEGKRYAVGEAAFKPDIVAEMGADMKLVSLSVPGKPVEPKFVESLGGWHWLTPYQKLEKLAPVFKAINRIEVTSGGVRLSVVKS